MNKIATILMCILLTGCTLKAQTVQELTDKCKSLNGTPVYVVDAQNQVWAVRCTIDGHLYSQGDY